MRNTRKCQGCSTDFLLYPRINGKSLNLSKRRYCLTCSPYGSLSKNRKPIIDGKRQCVGCKEWVNLDEFLLRGKTKLLRSHCRACDGKRATRYGQDSKARAVEYLGGSCCVCGYARTLRSLTFHHVEPDKKGFAIADFKCRKWEAIQEELSKCILLCANCHGEIEDGTICTVIT